MKPIFETCRPRPEVLAGDLTEDTFAARLRDVIEGTADPVYQDPATFFRNTFPTDGLRSLAREVLGRLSGREPANSPFIRLETSFGGGKTHNLIALHHLVSGGGQAAIEAAAENAARGVPHADIVPGPDWLPEDPWAVAGVVGSDLDPAEGVAHGAVRTRTLWGELAWQLGFSDNGAEGGAAAYEHVRRSDEALLAPGTQTLERVIGDRPTLIMLDEIARHLRTAKAVPTANRRSDLAEQTVAFLMTLIELAAGRDNIAFVLTLADSADAFSDETASLQKELQEARKVSARHERVITPAQESEIAPIVRHRLFESFDESAATETAGTYQEYYRQLVERGAEIPERMLGANFHEEMVRNYPFHPELFTVLSLKTATIPHFQKTRGALRLLLLVVRGAVTARYPMTWKTADAQARRSWANEIDATESGAAGIAIVLARRALGYVVSSRSRHGTGFDYWLEHDARTQPLHDAIRLEVSGIRRGTTAQVTTRLRQKLSQMTAGSVAAPGYAIVVEFGRPRAQVGKP